QVREIPPATVARARVFVDSRPAALEEAGDLILPIREGLITSDHVVAELGELLLGQAQGRTAPEEITFFKSVGVAVQDALAAQAALTRAMEFGIGQQVDW
ncbi:MAG TPA: ornithine cyclodeaminase, partial [Phycisphaerae bacterium]|nr:ornithine cyclodeaminase [Phycisphaerae bacterium]